MSAEDPGPWASGLVELSPGERDPYEGPEAPGAASAGEVRGSGGGAPPRLDTSRVQSSDPPGASDRGVPEPTKAVPGAPEGLRSGRQRPVGGATIGSGGATIGSAKGPKGPRSRTARGAHLGAGAWREKYSAALGALGSPSAASSARSCGATAQVWDCQACGTQAASAVIVTHCGQRSCPWCARAQSKELAARVMAAAARVSAMVAARVAGVASTLREVEQVARRARDRWLAAAERHERRHDRASATRSRGMARKAELRRVRHAWARYRTGEAQGWRWKLITISPRWSPGDPREVSPGGLRRRVDDVRRRWLALWHGPAGRGRLGLGVASLGAATTRVELSRTGHVHLHALVFGPYVLAETLRQWAGCHVDVRDVAEDPDFQAPVEPGARAPDPREALSGAIREATKYALKSPSPGHAAWIMGRAWAVPHPELAAAWTLGTRRQRLVEHWGLMREAVSASEALDGELVERADALKPAACPCCKVPLSGIPRLVPVARLAKELGAELWRVRVRYLASRG